MSTRSLIAVRQDDGTIKGVYCHLNGYPDGVGATLFEHYNSEEMANKIIALGDLSALGERLYPEKEYDKPRYSWLSSAPVKHSFDTPQGGVTIAYHRDRNEKLNINHFENKTEMNRWFRNSWCEYYYLFEKGSWYCGKKKLETVLKQSL